MAKLAATVALLVLASLGVVRVNSVAPRASASAACPVSSCRTRPATGVTASTTAVGRTPAGPSTTTATAPVLSPIYWGAYIDGSDTYSFLYGASWGDAPWDASTWHRFESNAGKKVSILHYGQPPPWEKPFDAAAADLVVSRGAIPAIDISTKQVPLRAVANGSYDISINAWATAAKAWGHPFFLLPDVEMNGTWLPYSAGVNGGTAADFVHAWRHMHDIFASVGATNATWVWCPNVDPTGKFTPYDQVYPGDAYVDWTGLDGFDRTGGQTFAWLFGASYRKLLRIAPTKPILISQTGSVEGGAISKPAWITDALSAQLPRYFPQVKALLWFNWRICEKGSCWNWEIESSASSRAAFAAAVASPYYASGGGFGNLKLLSKVRPLQPS